MRFTRAACHRAILQELIVRSNTEEHAVILTEEISMAMTVHSHGLTPADFPEIQEYEWDVEEDLHRFDWTDQYDNGLHYTNRTHDLALPDEHLRRVARSIVFDAKYEALKARVRDPVFEFQEQLRERMQQLVDGAVAQVCEGCCGGTWGIKEPAPPPLSRNYVVLEARSGLDVLCPGVQWGRGEISGGDNFGTSPILVRAIRHGKLQHPHPFGSLWTNSCVNIWKAPAPTHRR